MASDSKVITSLAIFQLIEAGSLNLTDKVQGILQLKTPSGGNPTDSNFGNITVQHLLEHTSGLQADAFRNNVAVKQAFDAAGHPVSLPVTAAMTDSYIASLSLLAAPGTSHYYNNCGYYLLSRVVAKKRGIAMIDAYQKFLFDPLAIKRIRLDTSLLASTPSDEARYQSPDLGVGPSVMTPPAAAGSLYVWDRGTGSALWRGRFDWRSDGSGEADCHDDRSERYGGDETLNRRGHVEERGCLSAVSHHTRRSGFAGRGLGARQRRRAPGRLWIRRCQQLWKRHVLRAERRRFDGSLQQCDRVQRRLGIRDVLGDSSDCGRNLVSGFPGRDEHS
jgi:hypothetical protein